MKILAIKLRALGDTVIWTSALAALRKLYPNAEIDVLSLNLNRPLLEKDPIVHRFIGIDVRDGIPLIVKLLTLRREHYDLTLAFHANTSLCRFLFLLNSNEVVAHHHSWPYTPPVSTRSLKRPGQLLDAVSRDYEILRALGWTGDPLPTHLFVDEEQSVLAEERLRGITDQKPRLAAMPGAGDALRRYPKDLWEEALKKLRQNFSVVIIADKILSREWRLRDIAERLSVPLIDDLNIAQLVATLSRFQYFIGNDSGPGHMAAALGLKSLHLFGPGCVGDWHPYNRRIHDYLRVHVDCRNQGPRDQDEFQFCTVKTCDHLSCLRKISPDRIVAAINGLAGS